MLTAIDPLQLRRVFGRDHWNPPQPFGDNGWALTSAHGDGSVLVTDGEWDDGHTWRHASIARPDRMPTYDDLVLLHQAAFGGGYAYQVFAPPGKHINIHHYALHLWGRADGARVLPDFATYRSI